MVELRSREEMMIRVIQVPKDRLPINEAAVKNLMASIKEVGVVEPIVVCEPRPQLGIYLVVGANRLEACKRLKHKTIPTRIVRGDTPEIQRWCKLAEIDENLVRRELSAPQRAKLTAQRKAVYVEEHPETKKGSAGGRAKAAKGKGAKRKNCATHETFVKDTAAKTGRSKRAVELDARRGKALTGDILDKVEGTSLAKGVELDALTNMNPEAREALVGRAAAGESISAVKEQSAPGKQGPIHARGKKLEPAGEAILELAQRVDVILDRDTIRERVDDVIPVAGELHPKARAMLVDALRGVAKRATRLADKLGGVDRAEARSRSAGNGVDAAESATARKVANAGDER